VLPETSSCTLVNIDCALQDLLNKLLTLYTTLHFGADAAHAGADDLQQQNGHHLAADTEPPMVDKPDFVASQHAPDQEQQHGNYHDEHDYGDDDDHMGAPPACSDPSQFAQEEEEEYKVTELVDDEGADFIEEEV